MTDPDRPRPGRPAARTTTPRTRGPYAGTAERRDAIVAAAFQVFAAHGYTGGSLQMVADRVGMSQTSLLHHFPKKSDLLLAVLKRRDDVASVDAPPAGDAHALVERVLARARTNESIPGLIELYTVLAGEAVTRGNPARGYVTSRLDRLRGDFTAAFTAVAAAGRLRPGINPATAAASLVGLWDGLQLQWLLAPDEVDVAGHLAAYLDLVLLPAD